jgi:hypothetical protein
MRFVLYKHILMHVPWDEWSHARGRRFASAQRRLEQRYLQGGSATRGRIVDFDSSGRIEFLPGLVGGGGSICADDTVGYGRATPI